MFAGMAHVAGDLSRFVQWMLALNVLADASILWLLLNAWGTIAAAAYVWTALPILSLLFFRYDLWPTACAVLTLVVLRSGHTRLGLVALASGTALKLWPVALVGVFLPRRVAPGWRPAIRAGLAALALAALWFWFGGASAFRDVLTYRNATGWDIESSVGSVWRLIEPDSLREESGTRRVGRIVPLLSVILGSLTLPAAIWALARGVRTRRVGTGWVAGIGVMLVGASLLSPQFLGWLLPGAAIAWAEADRRSARLVAGVIILTVAYRLLHTSDVPLLVLARNLVLIGTVAQAFLQLAAQPLQHEPVLRLEPHRPPDRRI